MTDEQTRSEFEEWHIAEFGFNSEILDNGYYDHPEVQDRWHGWQSAKERYWQSELPDLDSLAQFIRKIDGNHTMGANELAEKICELLSESKDFTKC